MNYLKSLFKLGLNAKEQDVYLALLQLEKATVNAIAKKAGTKRPTTYDILDRLKNGGFVADFFDGKKHYFTANSPEQILAFLDDQKREIQNDLPTLLGLYNAKIDMPKFTHFDGFSGIKELYENSLSALKKGDEILAFVTNQTPAALPEYVADYVQKRSRAGIRVRGIYNDSLIIRQYLRQNPAELENAKIVRYEDFPMKNEVNIYTNNVAIITYKPKPFGVLIVSKEIADTERAIFEMAWRGLSSALRTPGR